MLNVWGESCRALGFKKYLCFKSKDVGQQDDSLGNYKFFSHRDIKLTTIIPLGELAVQKLRELENYPCESK